MGLGELPKRSATVDIEFIVEGAGAETKIERGMNAQQGQVTGGGPDAGASRHSQSPIYGGD